MNIAIDYPYEIQGSTMPKVHITNTFTKKIKKPLDKKKIVYFDTVDIGFILEVRDTGTKSFYYRYNTDGTTHQKKLSSTTAMSANEARKLVQTLKTDKERTTPITINTLNQVTQEKSITLQEFWDINYLPFIKVSKRSYKKDIGFYTNHILPALGSIPMNLKKNYII